MTDIPDEAVQRAAEVMFRQYESQYDVGQQTWRDFAEDARAVLEAAAPGRPEPVPRVLYGIGRTPAQARRQTIGAACSSCGALAGTPCRTRKGTPAQWPHFPRDEAARLG